MSSDFLRNIKPGEQYTGIIHEVKSVEMNTYVVKINNSLITALSGITFNRGDRVTLEVKSNNGVPFLKLCRFEPSPVSSSFEKEKRLLKSCNLEISKKNIIFMSEFLKSGIGVQYDNIIKYFKEKSGH